MQADAVVFDIDGLIALHGFPEFVERALADAFIRPRDACFGIHIVFIREIAGEIRSLKCDGLIAVERLQRFHHGIVHFRRAVNRHIFKGQCAAADDRIIVDLGIAEILIAPCAFFLCLVADLRIDIAVIEPDGNINALDLVDMVLTFEDLQLPDNATDVEIEDALSEYLTDCYGFCHNGFLFDKV